MRNLKTIQSNPSDKLAWALDDPLSYKIVFLIMLNIACFGLTNFAVIFHVSS